MNRKLTALLATVMLSLAVPIGAWAQTPDSQGPTSPETTNPAPTTTAAPETTAELTTSVPTTAPMVELPTAQLPGRFSVGDDHACAVDANNEVWCWGSNKYGQLGNGTTTNSNKPVKVPHVRAIAVSANQWSTCVVNTDNKPLCWGVTLKRGGDARGGDPALSPKEVADFPAEVKLMEITLGYNAACGLTGDGDVWCWGKNQAGQLGNGTVAQDQGSQLHPPSLVPNFKAKKVSAGSNQVCAISAADELFCWGGEYANPTEQFDLLGTLDHSATPARMGNFKAKDVSAGQISTCALDMAGTPHCWGGTSNGGQAGGTPNATGEVVNTGVVAKTIHAGQATCIVDENQLPWCWGGSFKHRVGNTPRRALSIPANYGNREGFAAQTIQAEGLFACFVAVDGGVWCWGRNQRGQLGNGTNVDSASPVQVPGLNLSVG